MTALGLGRDNPSRYFVVNTLGDSPTDSASGDAAARRPAIDRSEAARLLEEAKRLYRVAELVQARRAVGGVESSVLAQRSLALALEVLVRLHGDAAPAPFEDLAQRAKAIAEAESLLREDLTSDLMTVDEMRGRFVAAGETSPADERRYDRAFIRSAEWLDAVERFLDERLPPGKSKLKTQLAASFAAVAVFVVGFVAGKHVRNEPSPVTNVTAPQASPASTAPSFSTTFYQDTKLTIVLANRQDPSIAFNWESEGPSDVLPVDHFGARWEGNLAIQESGKYNFFLTSDDGSRLFIDMNLVVDNWGNHAAVMKPATVELSEGVHPIRVDYYDDIGSAMVKLEWSSEHIPRRLITAADLR